MVCAMQKHSEHERKLRNHFFKILFHLLPKLFYRMVHMCAEVFLPLIQCVFLKVVCIIFEQQSAEREDVSCLNFLSFSDFFSC